MMCVVSFNFLIITTKFRWLNYTYRSLRIDAVIIEHLTVFFTKLWRPFPQDRGQIITCTDEFLKKWRVSSSFVFINPHCMSQTSVLLKQYRKDFASSNTDIEWASTSLVNWRTRYCYITLYLYPNVNVILVYKKQEIDCQLQERETTT